MTLLAPSFFKQGKVLHAAACCVWFRRRGKAIKCLPITDPSIKGGFGEVNSCGVISRRFRDVRRPLVKTQKTQKKPGKEQSERPS